MSLPNPETVVTEERLNEFYTELLPYLGGSADAGFTPVGTIIALMSNHAPANYLICDGTVYNIADYPELANHFLNEFGSKNYFGGDGTTTFAVPSLQGEFLRGAGTNSHSGQGNGSAVGVHQNATELLNWFYNNYKNLCVTYNKYVLNVDSTVDSDWCYYESRNLNVSDNTKLGKFTSRPTNTSVLYCIATKNIYLNPSLDYSTDEKVVGTWIDGKPLYQKTIQLTKATSANTWYTTPIGASVDTVVSLKGFCTDNAHYWGFENPMYGDATLPSFYAQNNNETTANIIAFYSTSNAWVGRTSYYATIQYTKTTD